jgi:hypothetical protein
MFTPREVFRWYTSCTLQELSVAELDRVVKILVAGEAQGRSTHEIARRLEPVLAATAYRWPTLEEWRARFQGAATRPAWLLALDPMRGDQSRRDEVFLFTQSARGAWGSARQMAGLLDTMKHVPDLQAEVHGPEPDDPCDICRPHAGERFDPRALPEGGIPPFHPDCRCSLTPYRPEWAPLLTEWERENERLMEERAGTWSPEARARWEEQRRKRRG